MQNQGWRQLEHNPVIDLAVQRFNDDIKVCECGACTGEHAIIIFEHFPKATIHLVDSYVLRPLSYLVKCVQNLYEYRNRLEWLLIDQAEAANKIKDEFFDMIHMDFTCDPKERKEYLRTWYPKVKKGGYFYGRNYLFVKNKISNKQIIDEFGQENGVKIHSQDVFWWIEKPCT